MPARGRSLRPARRRRPGRSQRRDAPRRSPSAPRPTNSASVERQVRHRHSDRTCVDRATSRKGLVSGGGYFGRRGAEQVADRGTEPRRPRLRARRRRARPRRLKAERGSEVAGDQRLDRGRQEIVDGGRTGSRDSRSRGFRARERGARFRLRFRRLHRRTVRSSAPDWRMSCDGYTAPMDQRLIPDPDSSTA